MIRLLISLCATALVACSQSLPAPTASPTTSATTMYYKESRAEPWSASPAGDMPSGWQTVASRAIADAGLHPLALDQVRTWPADTVTCQSALCPNLFALRVLLPGTEREVASERCFVTDAQDATPPAVRRTDCSPLFKP